MRGALLLALAPLLVGCAPRENPNPGAEEPPHLDAPKAEPAPPQSPDTSFDSVVTVRRWDESAGKFLPGERMAAVRRDNNKSVRWVLRLDSPRTELPAPKSEIIGADGVKWVVHRMERHSIDSCVCFVTQHAPARAGRSAGWGARWGTGRRFCGACVPR
jgi:hypothetical protein